MHARRLGEVVRVALLGRHGDDLAAILEHGPLAGRERCPTAGRASPLLHSGGGSRQVGGHADLQPVESRLASGSKRCGPAGLLVDDPARAGRALAMGKAS